MTEGMTLDGEAPPLEPAEAEAANPRERVCAEPGCENLFVVNPRGYGAARKYCDEHLRTGGGHGQRKRKPPKDRKPPSVRVTVGGSRPRTTSKDPELAAVEQRVQQVLSLAAGLLALAGGEHGPADALDIQEGKVALATAVAGLAEYYPLLRKLAASGEMSGKVAAWLQFAMALLAVLIPILLRHGAIPEQIGQFLGMASQVAPQPAATGESAGEPAAA